MTSGAPELWTFPVHELSPRSSWTVVGACARRSPLTRSQPPHAHPRRPPPHAPRGRRNAGEGSFGVVYRASLLGRSVAVKENGDAKDSRLAAIRRDAEFLCAHAARTPRPAPAAASAPAPALTAPSLPPRRLRISARFPHPNVVQILGSWRDGGGGGGGRCRRAVVILEFLPHCLRDRRTVARVDLVSALADVARALARRGAVRGRGGRGAARGADVMADSERSRATERMSEPGGCTHPRMRAQAARLRLPAP